MRFYPHTQTQLSPFTAAAAAVNALTRFEYLCCVSVTTEEKTSLVLFDSVSVHNTNDLWLLETPASEL